MGMVVNKARCFAAWQHGMLWHIYECRDGQFWHVSICGHVRELGLSTSRESRAMDSQMDVCDGTALEVKFYGRGVLGSVRTASGDFWE